jgi:hypothetical protein
MRNPKSRLGQRLKDSNSPNLQPFLAQRKLFESESREIGSSLLVIFGNGKYITTLSILANPNMDELLTKFQNLGYDSVGLFPVEPYSTKQPRKYAMGSPF